MFYTYILKSQKNSSHYIGSCENLNKRILLHNASFVKSTKYGVPWDVIYYEKFDTRSEAYIREHEIKSWKKRARIENLIKHFKNNTKE